MWIIVTVMALALVIIMVFQCGVSIGRSDEYENAYKDGMRDIIELIPDPEWQESALQFVNEVFEMEVES